jgi:hypothetical protein
MPAMIEPQAYVCKCEHAGFHHDVLTGRCMVMIHSGTSPLVFQCPCEKFEFCEAWTGQQSEGRKTS